MAKAGHLAGSSFVAYAFFFLIFAESSSAQQSRNNERPADCYRYDQVQIPPADLPAAQDRQALAKCDAYSLYFGFNGPSDAIAARKCAYLQRDDKNREVGNPFSGSALLAMIYANGKGANRNFELALKFSCEIDGAPAENASRFKHLRELQQENWHGTDFNLCDDATSGFLGGWCAKLHQDHEQIVQSRGLKTLTSRWSGAEKQAFLRLQQAANAYFKASSQNEVDLSGTGRAAFEIHHEQKLKREFLAALSRFEQGNLPNFTADQFRDADARLNTGYQKIQAKPATQGMAYGTVTPNGVKTAQRAWLRYRDAWVQFGAVKYPPVSADSWKTWLTEERIKLLQPWLKAD